MKNTLIVPKLFACIFIVVCSVALGVTIEDRNLINEHIILINPENDGGAVIPVIIESTFIIFGILGLLFGEWEPFKDSEK